jgi:hypothetical protein
MRGARAAFRLVERGAMKSERSIVSSIVLLCGWIVAGAVAATFCAGSRAASGSPSERRVRVIPWDPTRPLSEQLLPDDEVVNIERHLDLFEPSRPLTVKDVIDDATIRRLPAATAGRDRDGCHESDSSAGRSSWRVVDQRLAGRRIAKAFHELVGRPAILAAGCGSDPGAS